jgi:serine/threonine-protein kinase
MGDSPRRRTALGIGVAVVLAALVGAFAVLTWTHRDRDRDVAIPPPVTVRPTVTVSKPASAPSSAAPTSAKVSPKASLTFADAVSRMRAAVESGVAAGQIRRDVAQDLLNLLGPLSNAQGADITGQVQALRDKIRTRAGEGAMSQARAAVLQSRLEDLDRAAGT